MKLMLKIVSLCAVCIPLALFADVKVFNNTDTPYLVRIAWDAGSGQSSDAEASVAAHSETWIKGDLWNRKDYIHVFSGNKLVAEAKPKENKNLMLGEVGLGGGGNLRAEITQDDTGIVKLRVVQAGLLGEELH